MKIKFFKLAECLITDKQINSNELRVYIYLINLFNKQKDCSYPAIETIAKDINLSSRTVKNCIANLVKLGYMTIEKKKSVKGNYNTYKNFKFIIPDKEEKRTPSRIGIDRNGQNPLDGQITVEEALEEVEKGEINKIIQATGVTEQEAEEELRITKSKEGIKNIVQYTIGTINNKKRIEKELNEIVNRKQEINPLKFNNFEAREYDYDSLEKKLLGWDKQEEVIGEELNLGIAWLGV